MNQKTVKDKIIFFEHLGQMLNSGVPLGVSLKILSGELESEAMRGEVQFISENMEKDPEGKLKFYEYFNDSFFKGSTLAMLRGGESSGQLDFVCIKIANCLRSTL